MSLPVSEKNFLEKLASYVPGVAGYREREGRRETDRRLREFLAGRLEEAASSLTALRNAITRGGSLELMNDVARLDKSLQKAASSLRFADYGYSGLFDQVKIRDAELEQIYAYDLTLLGDVQALGERVHAASGGSPKAETLQELAQAAEGLDRKIVRRKELFDSPAGA
ncbi:MAG TPA: hypothetical protein VF139_03365 [Candidatus Polarisedimenticolaceae bacterium]